MKKNVLLLKKEALILKSILKSHQKTNHKQKEHQQSKYQRYTINNTTDKKK